MPTVKFSIKYSTVYGQVMRISGSHPSLGSWNIDHSPPMTWSGGSVWTFELHTTQQELPFEYKYVITEMQKKKHKIQLAAEATEIPVEHEVEVDEFVANWETSANRTVSGTKEMYEMRDKLNVPQQTDLELALEDRNTALEDLRSLEDLILPQYTHFPKKLGSNELAIGIIGEPDKSSIKGLPKDKVRALLLKGVLRKNENDYVLCWCGRQTYAWESKSDRRADVSEMCVFESKFISVDDRNAVVMKNTEGKDIQFTEIVSKLQSKPVSSSHNIFWDSLIKRWTLVPRHAVRKSRDASQENQPLSSSIRVQSEDTSLVSSYQIIPNSSDILCITTNQLENDAFTYVSVLDSTGKVLMPSTYVAPMKYEGMLLMKDTDINKLTPVVATQDFDESPLRQRELEVRRKIDTLHGKYLALKEQETVTV